MAFSGHTPPRIQSFWRLPLFICTAPYLAYMRPYILRSIDLILVYYKLTYAYDMKHTYVYEISLSRVCDAP